MPWLLLAIFAFIVNGVYYNYLIVHYDSIDDKKKVRNSALMQMVFGILLAIASFFSSVESDKQSQNIENLAKLDTALDTRNTNLGTSIQSLSNINNQLAKQNKGISDTIKSLNDSIHQLIKEIRQLSQTNLKIVRQTTSE